MSTPASLWPRRLGGFDAHHRFFIALGVAVAVTAACARAVPLRLLAVLAWDAFAATILLVSWLRIFLADAKTSALETKLQDSSRSAIFAIVVFAAVAALVGVAGLPAPAEANHAAAKTSRILFAGATVVLSWGLIHTVFALHYAHLFYQKRHRTGTPGEGSGLDFPQDPHPGFLDFAYFSFVVGMTCQVSDVQITSKRLRRLALWHGLLAFAYNTVILALTINLSSTVLFS